MHGAGNDYIYVDTRFGQEIRCPETAALRWSAPHTGIGADGLVLICPPSDPAVADLRMRIFNADGSEAMMCGNASRCIGKYAWEKGGIRKETVRMETLSGVKILHLHLSSDKESVESVTVDMLTPHTHEPSQWTGQTVDAAHPALWKELGVEAAQFVSMGNPHCVLFVPSAEEVDVERYGKELEHSPLFPERCNIEFVSVMADGSLRCRVWERGSGITQACGTGACATAVAAALTGRSGRQNQVVMDGGTLSIAWKDNDHIMMTGPATWVFDGYIDPVEP